MLGVGVAEATDDDEAVVLEAMVEADATVVVGSAETVDSTLDSVELTGAVWPPVTSNPPVGRDPVREAVLVELATPEDSAAVVEAKDDTAELDMELLTGADDDET